jgi:uncharacterized protein (TIGR00369 family)
MRLLQGCSGPEADKKPTFAMPAAPPKMELVNTTDYCQIECLAGRPMVSFKPKNPQFRSRVEQSFSQQQVMKTLGVKIVSLQPGEIELMMPYVAAYTQHTGFMHAGIIATVLDNACGYGAFTLVPDDTTILTVEFKTNLLAPAKGERFVFRGKVVKPGRLQAPGSDR